MEETTQNQPITPAQPPIQIIEHPKSQFSIFLSILLSALITGGLVYWWQSRVTESTTSQLQSQIDNLQNQLSQSAVPQPTSPSASNAPTTSQSSEKTATWQTHTDYEIGYSIDFPKDWRKVDFGKGSIGVGPSDVGEDVKWVLNVYDSSATTIDTIISDMGKQFQDRKEKREEVVVWAGGAKIKAIKAVVTTPQVSDWLYELVIFERKGKIIAIGNGAIKDSDFELFYNSFLPLGPLYGN